MKSSEILVVYYSLEGNTELISTMLRDKLNCDLLKIEPQKKERKGTLSKYIWGGKQVFLKEEPELKPYTLNPEDYQFLFIGTPVWAGSYTPPIRTFLKKHAIKEKEIALFCCQKGHSVSTLDSLETLLSKDNNNVLHKGDFYEPNSKYLYDVRKQVETYIRNVITKTTIKNFSY
ncbi:flavodoxin family protein [Natranaerobius trueperi]|uniref:flavodoxin family protein n=1 Tax=Natranaerobius trueperi TaxID=759412 RepID=UPI0013038BEF|nr:flavodoxin [Natranaerobius trueperi]